MRLRIVVDALVGLVGLVACSACSHDIRLGDRYDAMPDGLSDAPSLPFDPGSYQVSFLGPAQVGCQGTLTGKESDFAGLTPASSGLIDGAVSFAVTTTQLSITGAPIQAGFPQPTIVLAPDPMAMPPTLWDTGEPGACTSVSGPDATTRMWCGLAADSATAHAVGGIQSGYAELFQTTDTMGGCSVSFGALFVRS
jgi:hypothetical protein